MKILVTILSLFFLSLSLHAQENSLALFGGYSFSTGSVSTSQPTGWKINALYEFTPNSSSWSVGGAVGYISLSGSSTNLVTSSSFKVQTVPISLVPKFSFGSESFKGYLRGIIGSAITTTTYTGSVVGTSDNQWGMSFGFGAGATYFLNEKMFLSADYEWLRISNIYDDAGAINSASVGIGMKF
jgi:opacity protein-like surface antigen